MKRMYVFHNPNFLDRMVLGGMGLELVAAVDGNGLEDAFRLTNTIEFPWWENDDVIATFEGAYTGKGCRSTSISDVVIMDDVVYECMPCGWEKHDHLTKWWNKLKKENSLLLVEEKEKYLNWVNEEFNFNDLIAEDDTGIDPEEDFLAGRYDAGNEPFHFTFDEKDNVADKDIPF